MRTNVVLTLTGKDRVGLVEEVTQLLLDLGGNVETSRMARLGGEFAILMLVSLAAEQLGNLESDVHLLAAQGFKATMSQTELTYAQAHAGWQPYQIEVEGADHEGIIHEIAHSLSQRGISIEAMETSTQPAPVSGSPLFMMTALVVVPPNLPGDDWQAELAEAGHHLNVGIRVSALQRQ